MKQYTVTRRDMQGKDYTVIVTANDKNHAAYRAAGKLADMGVTFTRLISIECVS